MPIKLIHPISGRDLKEQADVLSDDQGNSFEKIQGVYRMVTGNNYTDSFGFQWNKFSQTQIDPDSKVTQSRERFFGETGWKASDLGGAAILEVGSGAGRFTQVILQDTAATVYSVDFSSAVEANFRNNGHFGGRLQLFQASIYELPFPDNSFAKVFCFGTLQHTPDFEGAVRALIRKAKPGGEIVVDFYPIKGWWTKINSKYILRPLTKRMSRARLYNIIESNIDWLIAAHLALSRVGLHVLTRFLPVCDITATFPKRLAGPRMREWAILDTFDMYSPEHDHPQRVGNVAAMFARNGAAVTFAGFKAIGEGKFAAVVKGVKR